MAFVALAPASALHDGYRGTFEVGALRLLLIQVCGERFLVENRCGHFGVAIDGGEIHDGSIECPQHFMRFDLRSGVVLNPQHYADCDPIRVFALIERDGQLGLNLP